MGGCSGCRGLNRPGWSHDRGKKPLTAVTCSWRSTRQGTSPSAWHYLGMVQNQQEYHYGEGIDYRHGSPHLTHWRLHDALAGRLRRKIVQLSEGKRSLSVLEIGAGHGGFTEPTLAAGCKVTAVEMSRHSVAELEERFGANDRFKVLYDSGGDLDSTGAGFDLVLAVAVLHHIPDYQSYLDRAITRLRPGGTLLTLQDPLWYPRHRAAHRLDRLGYLAWRTAQGDLSKGAATLLRRARASYDETKPEDMVEYHVVRQGVDEDAVLTSLQPRFSRVAVVKYWSNQLALAQRLGDRLGAVNVFGIDASGYVG